MSKKIILRGEIWTADLRPGTGHEITKIRPVLIISTNAVNKISPTIIVIPISSQMPPVIGSDRIFLSQEELKLAKDSILLCGQVRTLDKSRIQKKIDVLSKQKLREVEESLMLVLELD